MQRAIREEHEILQVQVLGTGQDAKPISLVTSTEQMLSLWNYTRLEKILAIDVKTELQSMVTVVQPIWGRETTSFAFLVNNQQSDGKVYVFSNR